MNTNTVRSEAILSRSRRLPYTVFVGGVTGSGKTTLCERIAEMLEGKVRVIPVGDTATAIARSYDLAGESIEETSLSALREIQRHVVKEIIGIQLDTPADTIILLDGHFILGGINRSSFRQPKIFFSKLGVSSLILCETSSSEIHRRIQANPFRLRPAAIVESLNRYAEEEAKHARFIAHKCKIPLALIRGAQDIPLSLAIIARQMDKSD